MEATKFSGGNAGLRVVIYPGDNKILIAMSIDDNGINDSDKNLAGFAIWRKYDGKPEEILANRISFDSGVNSQTTSATREWTDSDQAPFQKFRWVDVPADGFDVPITYRVQARYFTGQGFATKAGPEVSIRAEPVKQLFTKFRPAFTRGYIASQAYADKFQNKDIRPHGTQDGGLRYQAVRGPIRLARRRCARAIVRFHCRLRKRHQRQDRRVRLRPR